MAHPRQFSHPPSGFPMGCFFFFVLPSLACCCGSPCGLPSQSQPSEPGQGKSHSAICWHVTLTTPVENEEANLVSPRQPEANLLSYRWMSGLVLTSRGCSSHLDWAASWAAPFLAVDTKRKRGIQLCSSPSHLSSALCSGEAMAISANLPWHECLRLLIVLLCRPALNCSVFIG